MDTINPLFIIAPTLTVLTSLLLWVSNAIITDRREKNERKRRVFSEAYAAVIEYKEVPYMVRRRGNSSSDERQRVSNEIRQCQKNLTYYSAWLSTESLRVSQSYIVLVENLRRVAGQSIHDSWLLPSASSDADMNIADIDLSVLIPFQEEFIQASRDDLSCWPAWVMTLARLTCRRRNFRSLLGSPADAVPHS